MFQIQAGIYSCRKMLVYPVYLFVYVQCDVFVPYFANYCAHFTRIKEKVVGLNMLVSNSKEFGELDQ